MFGFDQRERLLREEGWTANGLAEELYSMFGDTVPNNTQAPIVINQPVEATVAPIQIGNYQDGNPIFGLKKPDGTVQNISISGGNWVIDDGKGGTTKIC